MSKAVKHARVEWSLVEIRKLLFRDKPLWWVRRLWVKAGALYKIGPRLWHANVDTIQRAFPRGGSRFVAELQARGE
jgi:hypothetical protein